jgi:hypothetical protein
VKTEDDVGGVAATRAPHLREEILPSIAPRGLIILNSRDGTGENLLRRVLYSCYVNRQTRGLPETKMPKHEDYRVT